MLACYIIGILMLFCFDLVVAGYEIALPFLIILISFLVFLVYMAIADPTPKDPEEYRKYEENLQPKLTKAQFNNLIKELDKAADNKMRRRR